MFLENTKFLTNLTGNILEAEEAKGALNGTLLYEKILGRIRRLVSRVGNWNKRCYVHTRWPETRDGYNTGESFKER